MGVTTWDGSASTDWATAANWDTGSVPTGSTHVVIPDTSSINNCVLDQNRTVESFRIDANGTFDGDGNTLTIDNEGDATTGASEGYAIRIDGIISGSDTDFAITTPAATNVDLVPSSGTIRNLTINHASAVVNLRSAHTTLSGNLTITAGQLDTYNSGSNINLTVTGDAIVDGTLTGNASAISLGSLAIGGTYSATSGTTTITSERSNGRAIDIVGTYTHNSGTLKIQTAADTDLRCPSSSSLNHLIIDHASCIARPTGDNKPPIAGDLTINQGKYSLLDSDGSSTHQSTVTGDVIIGDGSGSANTAIFEGRDDSVTFGSLTIDSDGQYDATSGTTTITSMTSTGSGDRSLNNKSGGTFANNDGTVLFNAAGDQRMEMAGTGNVHNLTLSKSDNDLVTFGNLTVEGDLSITLATVHTMRPNNASETLTVTGNATIVEGKLGDVTNYTGAHSFGSLTIESGGTYIATSGTTKLTGKNGSNYMLQNSGTFTHNKGTVRFEADTSSGTWYATNATNVEADSIKFYNLETVRTGSAGSYRFFVGGNSFYLVVLNNLTIGVNTNIHSSNGTSILRHYGPLFNIEGSAGFDNVTDVQCGFITIGSAGIIEFDSGDQAISCTGIRNLRGSAGIQA